MDDFSAWGSLFEVADDFPVNAWTKNDFLEYIWVMMFKKPGNHGSHTPRIGSAESEKYPRYSSPDSFSIPRLERWPDCAVFSAQKILYLGIFFSVRESLGADGPVNDKTIFVIPAVPVINDSNLGICFYDILQSSRCNRD